MVCYLHIYRSYPGGLADPEPWPSAVKHPERERAKPLERANIYDHAFAYYSDRLVCTVQSQAF